MGGWVGRTDRFEGREGVVQDVVAVEVVEGASKVLDEALVLAPPGRQLQEEAAVVCREVGGWVGGWVGEMHPSSFLVNGWEGHACPDHLFLSPLPTRVPVMHPSSHGATCSLT